MNRKQILVAVALAVGGFVAAADAVAQFGGMGGGGMGGGRSRGGSRGQHQEQQQQQKTAPNPETGANMLEQTIEELRIDLKLLPTQVPAWESYVGKARLLAGDVARERVQTSTASTQNSALKRIDRSVDAARNRLSALEDIAEAAKALYALLTPDQLAIADPRLAALVPLPNGNFAAPAPRNVPPR